MSGFARWAIDSAIEDWPSVQRCNECLQRLVARRLTEVTATGAAETSKTAWKCAVLQQALLYRATSLASGTADAWNAENIICAVIAARALMETVALADCVVDEIIRNLQAENVVEIDDFVNRQLFATRNEQQVLEGYGFHAKSVIKYISNFDKKIDGVSDAYSFLCEFAHPNGSGHFMSFGELDRATGTVRFTDAGQRVKALQHHVVTAFFLLAFMEPALDAFDRVIPQISKVDGFTDPWINDPSSFRRSR
jgi:hypothetical protein